MHRVQKVRAPPDYRLFVEFSDGVKGEVDLSDRLFGSVFRPLEDPEIFNQVSIEVRRHPLGEWRGPRPGCALQDIE